MAKVHAPLLSFNSGEVSKFALPRVDLAQMRLAAEQQVNWTPFVLGPMMLRPGTKYLLSTRSDAKAKYLPFIFANDDTALIELTDSHMRIIVSDAVLTAPSVATAMTSGTFSASTSWTLTATSGASATVAGGYLKLHAQAVGSNAYAEQAVTVASGDQGVVHRLRIVVARGPVEFQVGSATGGEQYVAKTSLGTGTHSIAFTPAVGTIYVRFSTNTKTTKWVDSVDFEAAGAVDLPTDWALADLPYIRATQSGDIVFVACDGFHPRQIERRDNNSWSIVRFYNEGGPFTSPPSRDADIVMDPALLSGGTQTITASRAFFSSGHELALIRVHLDDQSKLEHLAGDAAFTKPFRVSGANTQDRSFTVEITGTWAGSITGMRSVDGPDSGFHGFSNDSSNVTSPVRTVDDSTSYANIDVWYRYGFRAGEYTSGNAIVSINYGGYDSETPRGYSRIMTPISSTTTVDAEHIGLTSSLGSKDWEISEWPSPDLTPSTNALFDGRLWWAGYDRLWGSVSDDFTNYDDQTEGDSGPISRSIGIGPIARINWLLPLTRLIVGCAGSEVSVRSSAFDEPITPTNFTLKECSTQGSANLPALKIDTRGVFVEKSGRRVYELAYDINIQDYRARDLTHFNADASGGSAFVALAVQRQPETILHFVRADGQVAVLVQGPEDQVEAWWRVQTLGVVEDIVVLPGTQEDSVYYVVKRTINGSTKRFLEKFALRTQCQGGSLSRNIDCHAVISQSSSTTVSGLSHLEGESVKLWANGKDLGSYTVASGAITASEAVTTGIVGLGGVSFSYDSATAAASVTCATKYNGYPAEIYASGPNGGEMRYVGTVTIASGIATLPNGHTATKITAYLGFYGLFRSAKLAYGAQMGTALAQLKKIEKLGLIFYDTHYQGLSYGSGVDNLQPLPTTEGGVDTAADTVWPEYDRPMIGLSGSWDTDDRLHLVAQSPKPATVAAAIIAITTSEAR